MPIRSAGDAKVKTKALNARDIWFRRRSAVAAEDALQLGCRTNDIAHVLAALTFENTGLNGIYSGAWALATDATSVTAATARSLGKFME